jgi:flagellar hook-associated protein 1 FlgK
MSLTLALNNALSGLNISQKGLSVLSQNITNANTAGYSKEIMNQQAVYLDGNGAGVSLDSITRKANDLLQQTVRTKSSDLGLTTVVHSYLQQAQTMYGQPGGTGSIDQNLQTFLNNMQALSVSPESVSAQQVAVSSAVTLAKQVSTLASGLQSLRLQADQQIANTLGTVNEQLTTLYNLNAALARAGAAGQQTTGLLDQRDKALLTLSQSLDISVNYLGDGEVQVYAGGGIPLVDYQRHELQYKPASSVNTFINDTGTGALQVVSYNGDGAPTGNVDTLVTAGATAAVTGHIASGTLGGLLQLRDTILPQALSQLDNFAAGMRDNLNALQNAGSGYPGVSTMTGTRAVSAQDTQNWSGDVRIAVLDASGQPVNSPFADETGVTPLTLHLGDTNGGSVSVQNVIDAINAKFGPPQNKTELGNLNNISLVSQSPALPGGSQSLTFDFALDNISGGDANFWVTNVQVKDDTGANISNVTSGVPSFSLNPLNTYTTEAGSKEVVIRTQTPPQGLSEGDVVYLNAPAGPSVNGISSTDLGGYFVVHNVTGAGFTITATGNVNATTTGPVSAGTPITGMQKYAAVAAGDSIRTGGNGSITADFSANPFSSYYDITAQVAQDDGTGNVKSGTVTYRVYNNQSGLLNQTYAASSASGNATLVVPTGGTAPLMSATLVDANGSEIAKNPDGTYIDVPGYLKLTTANGTDTVAVDEMNSKESGTGRGFSHFFDLNDLFVSNAPTASGDKIAGSAINLAVNGAIAASPSALSTGTITRSPQPAEAGAAPTYTYERISGDNGIAQRAAALATQGVDFAAAGGLPGQNISLVSYASQVLGSAAASANNYDGQNTSNQALLEGFQNQLSSLTGVNLDEELANTVVYQNSYAATARIITVVDQMMQDLIGVFQ